MRSTQKGEEVTSGRGVDLNAAHPPNPSERVTAIKVS